MGDSRKRKARRAGRLSHWRGRLAEQFAACIVAMRGYRVIARNFSGAAGEIDIIAQRRGLIAIIEVRLRSTRSWVDGAESVDAAKQRRLIQTTHEFVQRHPSYNFHEIRFDVLTFGRRNYRPHLGPTIRWIKHAFTPDPQASHSTR